MKRLRSAKRRNRCATVWPCPEVLETRLLLSTFAQDTSFGDDGFVPVQFMAEQSGGGQPQGFVIQGDGRIVEFGTSFNGDQNSRDFSVVRFNTDGSLDTGFNGTGRVTINFGNNDGTSYSDDTVYSAALQADGKIVLVGKSANPNLIGQIAVARLNADGSLDTSFDGDGKRVLPIRDASIATGVVVQVDGRIVVPSCHVHGVGDVSCLQSACYLACVLCRWLVGSPVRRRNIPTVIRRWPSSA